MITATSSYRDRWRSPGGQPMKVPTTRGRMALGEDYDGKSWSVVPTAGIRANGASFAAVTGAGSRLAWAVGSAYDRSGTGFVERPLVERWAGTVWRRMAVPDVVGHLADVVA